ncbi:MAG: histidine kinase [Cyclobacteriaceae bacterium]
MIKIFSQPIPYRTRHLVWAYVAVCGLIMIRVIEIEDQQYVFNFTQGLFYLVNYSCWILFLRPVYTIGLGLKKDMLKWLFISLIILIIHFGISNLLYYSLLSAAAGAWKMNWTEMGYYFLPGMLSRTIELILMVALFKIIEHYRALHEKSVQWSEMKLQLQEAQLSALKHQMQPHFLFNALHNLSSLIGYDDAKARSLTIKISNLLRKMLLVEQQDFHSLEEEMNYINDYLDIEKERFHDRLIIDVDFDEASKASLVPTLFTQPLIENAFKHGISLLEEPSKLTLEAYVAHEQLHFTLTNRFNPNRKATHSNGVGLVHLKKRLTTLYGNEASFQHYQRNNLFTVQIKLPHEID